MTGEIVAIVHAMEMNPTVQKLEAGANIMPNDKSIRELTFPHFAVYESNAANLDQLAAPIPRKLAYFFDNLPILAGEVGSIAHDDTVQSERREQHLREVREELRGAFDLADDILLSLRRITSPRSHAKHIA
ncbi:MAG: hypothetical protein ACRD3W_28025 [Terriglobales bacterium]